MRIRLLIAAMLVSLGAVLIPVAPASADPAACAFIGQASVSPGLRVTDPLRVANYSFSAVTAICSNGINSVSGSGTLRGTCGHSTVGVFTPDGGGNVAGHSITYKWVSAGTNITIVSASTGAAIATVNARAAGADPANGVVPCVTVDATTFDVVGVAAGAHV